MGKKSIIGNGCIVAVLFFAGMAAQLFGQSTEIGGVVNQFTRITSLAMYDGEGFPQAVVVTDTTDFSAGDTVIVYQPKGFLVDSLNQGGIINTKPLGLAGKYSVLIIKKIHPDKTVEFFVPFFYFNPPNENYRNGEIGMLIRVPSYENAVVTAPLTTEPWDPDSTIGGVVALFVKRKLTLQADIDVTGLGFRGADPGTAMFGGTSCYADDPTGFARGFFQEADSDSSGLRGEGAEATNFSLLRGRFPGINGGGGGNGRYSGGGGGSNYTLGSEGGFESNICGVGASDEAAGLPGRTFGPTSVAPYTNFEVPYDAVNHYRANRIFFGGGGGTGTQDPGFPASAGGNGGGIVIIIADTLEMDPGVEIRADGESVTDVVEGAGGGGGGGGTIVLDVTNYKGQINLSARGRDGGATNNETYETGPGGAGGGGIYWLRHIDANVNYDISEGDGGTDLGAVSGGSANDGSAADYFTELNAPLDGFLFNVLPPDTAVCNNIIPDPIDASSPKGGDGNYTYTWQYHDLDNPNDTTTVTGAGEDFVFTEPLTTDRKFWRIVQSGDIIEGDPTATGGVVEAITYFVLDSIRGDDVILQQENDSLLCEGADPLPLIQNPDSTYIRDPGTTQVHYLWYQRSDLSSDWGLAISTDETLDPGILTDTTWYKRVHIATKGTAASGQCVAEDSLRINVLPRIESNNISADTVLCKGQTPFAVGGPKPQGGDQAVFRYQWQQAPADNEVSYADTIGISSRDFQPPALSATRFYRRVYFSGNNETCVDTSNVVEIEVLEPITGNSIAIDPSTDSICQGNTVDPLLAGSLPQDGRPGVYRYVWEVREWDAGSWSDIGAPLTQRTGPVLPTFEDTSQVRRIVLSGEDDVCKDTSNTISVKVISRITDNLLLTPAFDTCQQTLPRGLDALTPGGGDGTYGFLWEVSQDETNWTPADGISENSLEDFQPDTLFSTSYFRRVVWSDASNRICRDTSASLLVTIQPRIRNNSLSHDNVNPMLTAEEYECFDSDLLISGTNESSPGNALSGGDGGYSYEWHESVGADTLTFTVTGVTADSYAEFDYTNQRYFRRIVYSGECLDTTRWMEVVVKRLPAGMLALAEGEFSEPCEEDPVVFDLAFRGETDVTGYDFAVFYDTVGGSGSFIGNISGGTGTADHLPATADSTEYIYRLGMIEDSNGCVAPADSMDGSVTIKVFQRPDAEIIAAPEAVCGPVISLSAIPDRGGIGKWELYDGGVTASFSPVDSEDTQITIDPLVTDLETMTYAWVLTTPRCSDTAFATVEHYQDPAQPPYFEKDTVKIFFSDNDSIFAIPPTAGTGTWTVADGSFGAVPEDAVLPGVEVYNLELSESLDPADISPNTFIWTVSNGVCGPYSDEVTVIRLDVTQYDGFSPNEGDDLNRYYVMRGASAADDFTFRIYNSWGTLVRTVTKQDAEAHGRINQGSGSNAVQNELILWDGTAADGLTKVPDGTYYYSIELEIGDENYIKKGYILLKTRN